MISSVSTIVGAAGTALILFLFLFYSYNLAVTLTGQTALVPAALSFSLHSLCILHSGSYSLLLAPGPYTSNFHIRR